MSDNVVNVMVISKATNVVVNVALFVYGTIWPDDDTYYYRYQVGDEWIGWTWDPTTGEYTAPPPYPGDEYAP